MTDNTNATTALPPPSLDAFSWILKKEVEESKPVVPLQADTLSKGKKKVDTSTTLATNRVQLPPSTSSSSITSGITFDLKEIADFFAEFYNMGAKLAQSQTSDFSNLISLDQSMNTAQMETANQAIDKQQTAIKQAADLANQQAQMEKVQKVLNWVMVGVMVASVAILIVAAVLTGGAALVAAPEIIAGEAALTTAEFSVTEGGAEVIELGVMSTTELGAGAVEGTVDLGVGSLEIGVETAAETGAESVSSTTTQAAAAMAKKIAQALLNKLFQALVQGAVGLTTAADMGYKSYSDFKNAASLGKIAESQTAVGGAVAMMKYTSQISQYFQNMTQRTSDTLTNTSKMLNVAPETLGQIFQTLEQVAEQASQAAVKG